MQPYTATDTSKFPSAIIGMRMPATAARVPATPQRVLDKGEELFAEGDNAEYFYKVVSGAIRTYKLLSDGRRQIDAFHLEGDIFGLEAGASHRFSAEAVGSAAAASTHEWAWAKEPIERVFTLNMGIYKLKYSMNMLLNLMHHSSVAVALCLVGWLALEGRIEVGTVVAMVGGLGKLNDPWGDLVNWARELSVVNVKYRLFADVVNRILGFSTPSLRPGWWQWRRT